MSAVISSIRSSGNGGSQSGRMAMLISFIGLSFAATAAAMDDCPLAALAHPYGDRLHDAAAVGFPVAGLDVHMQAAQTVWTMVR